jgi:hypothetical protein
VLQRRGPVVLARSLEPLLAFGEASVAVMRARAVLEDRCGTGQARAELEASHDRLRALFASGEPGVCELALSVIVLTERLLSPLE